MEESRGRNKKRVKGQTERGGKGREDGGNLEEEELFDEIFFRLLISCS
jgi:hypothetical protein